MAKLDLRSMMTQQERQTSQSSPFAIRRISILNLSPSPQNVYAVDNIDALAENIREFGLMHNLVVREAGEDGMHEIISGERRYRACLSLYQAGDLRFEALPCKVEPGDDAMSELRLLYANATARVITDYELYYQATQIRKLLLLLKERGQRVPGRIRENVAGIMGVSPAQIGRYESIEKHLSQEDMQAFRDGKIGITQAYELSTQYERSEQRAIEEDGSAEKPEDAGNPVAEKVGTESAEAKRTKPGTTKPVAAKPVAEHVSPVAEKQVAENANPVAEQPNGWTDDHPPLRADADGIGNVLVWRGNLDIDRWDAVEPGEWWMRCIGGPPEE